MSTPLPAEKFATLAGSVQQYVGGTIDADALIGSAVITARRSDVALETATPLPTIVALPKTVCSLVSGAFSGVKLLGGDIPESNFTRWTYHVEFDVMTPQGVTVEIEGFDFVALAGESMNIATVKRVKPSAGVLNVKLPVDPDEPAAPIVASPSMPYAYDGDGTESDYVSFMAATGVDWFLNGNPVTAGLYYVTGDGMVTAVAQTGYVLSGSGVYPYSLSSFAAIHVTASEPFWDNVGGTMFIPVQEGIVYYMDGMPLAQGEYIAASGTVYISAQASEGYALDGASYWVHDFNATEPTPTSDPEVTFDDVLFQLTVTPVTGVEYRWNQFDVIASGTQDASPYWNGSRYVLITAVPLTGYSLPGGQSYIQFAHTYPPA